jgi:transposase
MPLLGAVPVMLSTGERTTLKKRVWGAKTPWRDRLRAQIVLAAARGRGNARIARDLGIGQDTARKWRRRFAVGGLDGLADLPRPGRPRRISEMDRAAVVALACQLPAATGVPLGRWTGPELAASWRPGRWPAPCRRHRSCGSWLSTRSSHGSTSRGSTPATRTSRPRRR